MLTDVGISWILTSCTLPQFCSETTYFLNCFMLFHFLLPCFIHILYKLMKNIQFICFDVFALLATIENIP